MSAIGVQSSGSEKYVCTMKLLQNQSILGGPGKIVQIDESLLCHNQKVHCVSVNHSHDV